MSRNSQPARPPLDDRPVVDAALLTIPARFRSTAVRITGRRFLTIRGVQKRNAGHSAAEGGQGDLVCHDGATSFFKYGNHRCGRLQDKDVTQGFTDGFVRRGLNVVRVRSLTGDSGSSTYLKNGVAAGLVTGGNDQTMYFTQIAVATRALGNPTVTVRAPAITAPRATTGDATNVTTTSATLNGVVNPSGAATTYRFEYGETSAYGAQTAETSVGAGRDNRVVSANITGLQPGRTYHVRLVATNQVGTTRAEDKTFLVPSF